MPLGLKALLTDYSSAIQEGNAALFIGAGMSREKGAPNWKDLLSTYARLVGLDVEKENDLAAVAQYYLNSKNGERSFLNQALIDVFDKPELPISRNYRSIARLPVSTLWTTNYDEFIEHAFREANKKLDVKLRDEDIGVSRKCCKAVLYKMHGDISQPDKVIISKQDYERYPRTHPIFQKTLTTDLLRKTFLILGFGFEDPNFKYTLGHLYSLLDNKKRAHYAVMRYARRKRQENQSGKEIKYIESKSEFEYRKKKQVLLIDDLQRYGIKTILIDNFDQVAEILDLLDQRVRTLERIQRLRSKSPTPSEEELKKVWCRRDGIMVLKSERWALGLFQRLRSEFPILSEPDIKAIIESRDGEINIDHIELSLGNLSSIGQVATVCLS